MALLASSSLRLILVYKAAFSCLCFALIKSNLFLSFWASSLSWFISSALDSFLISLYTSSAYLKLNNIVLTFFAEQGSFPPVWGLAICENHASQTSVWKSRALPQLFLLRACWFVLTACNWFRQPISRNKRSILQWITLPQIYGYCEYTEDWLCGVPSKLSFPYWKDPPSTRQHDFWPFGQPSNLDWLHGESFRIKWVIAESESLPGNFLPNHSSKNRKKEIIENL